MNDDLISRSALLKKATNVTKYDEGGWGVDLKAVSVEDVLKAPAVDAETVFEQMGLVKEAFEMAKADLAPVQYARWEETVEDWVMCSACGVEWNSKVVPIEDFHYCPNCGKRIKEGLENG